ncbi:hypothetical protein PtA15_6A506 [Puccinia triticina]|uniref:Rgp1-domain-containing protein n=1 Tax=Puccinia triticina TaxID=208348 RepID=A0ABY7CPG3_9BASI|nr:uncharacterized protein PtA15_6A506 [Puccinia triticina]WAQ85877.1 hypothetical protein PtA15_6A506 [Puccinia triticina]
MPAKFSWSWKSARLYRRNRGSRSPDKAAYFAGERFECTIEFRAAQTTANRARLSAASISPSPSTHPPSTPAESDYYLPPRNSLLPKRQGLIGSAIQQQTYHHRAESAGSAFPNPSFSFSIQEPLSPNHSSRPSPNLPASPKTGGPGPADGIGSAEHEPGGRGSYNHLSQLATRKTSTPTPGTVYPSATGDQTFNPRRASLFALGASAPAHRTGFSRTTASTPTRPERSSTALLGWTYCQLEGYFEISPKHFDLAQFDALHHPQTRGGGTLLDDHHHLSHSRRNSASWIGWLFGAAPNPNHYPGSPSSSASSTPPNRFPVFKNPISLLDVDVRLEPGQTRSYSFAIDLPVVLPPTHRGKLIKFNYELIVGTNLLSSADASSPTSEFGNGYRAGRGSTPALSADPARTRFSTPSAFNLRPQEHKNQTFRVPIRVFNHVYLNETKPFYDLFQPIIVARDMAQTRRILVPTTTAGEGHSGKSPSKATKKTDQSAAVGDNTLGGLAGLESYALELLNGAAATGRGNDGINPPLPAPDGNPPAPARQEDEWGEELDEGCIAAVEIVSRSAPKVSFDINKDGRLVAHLTLVKSTYRQGETIEGTIEMNGSTPAREGGRVVRWGISLETLESLLPPSTAEGADGKRRTVRKVYAESEEMVIDCRRARFALVVPRDPAPAFTTSLVSLVWTIKLRFLFVPCPPPFIGTHLVPLDAAQGTFMAAPHLGFLASHPPPSSLPPPVPIAPPPGRPAPSVSVSVAPSPPPLRPLPSTNDNPLHHSDAPFPRRTKEMLSELFQCDLPITILPSTTPFLPPVHHFAL